MASSKDPRYSGASKGWYTNNYRFLPVADNNKNTSNKKSIIPDSIIKTTKYSGYIKDTIRNRTIGIASLPEAIDENVSASISTESPVGSPKPVVIYSSTGARTMSFSIKVYQDYLPSGFKSVVDYVKAIKLLVYPKINDVVTPPECEFFLPGVQIIGICTSVGVSWGSTFKDGSPDYASIQLSITETKLSVEGDVYVK